MSLVHMEKVLKAMEKSIYLLAYDVNDKKLVSQGGCIMSQYSLFCVAFCCSALSFVSCYITVVSLLHQIAWQYSLL